MTKQEALDRLSPASAPPTQAMEVDVMIALEHGATVDEVAQRMRLTVRELELTYPDALDEAGRLPARPPRIAQ